ncbi:hypothetical protein [uncultured Muribaculum sp.]|uniref:hypothetical protein n=1 Tax=uncultured Muribaculum sp. TaxID=1918613 RepID=UPI0025CCE7BA|nr:hypothetical protein [uncultured Muribaculum sp.]
MSTIRPYTLLAALAALTASGQTLSKEITVDKDVVPQEREASRMIMTPKLVLPAIERASLKWTDRGVTASVPSTIATLPPAAYASSITPSPYRGYVMAGYFPTFQAGLSAGYRIVRTEDTDFGAWLQYDGSNVKRTPPYAEKKISYDTQDVRVGLDGSHKFAGVGTISGRASYGFSSFNFPSLDAKGFTQNVNRVDVGLDWHSQLGAFDYSVGIGYDYFGFSKPVGNDKSLKAEKNNTLSLALGGAYALSDAFAVGADVDFNTTKFTSNWGWHIITASTHADAFELQPVEDSVDKVHFVNHDNISYSMTEAHPYLRWKDENLTVKAGVGVQIAGGDRGSNRVRPDLHIDWTPSSSFGMWAQLNDRRVDMQTLGSRYDRNRYINPNQVAGPMWDKWRVEGGMIIGPFKGASIELWGGTARVNSYFSPVVFPGMYYYASFTSEVTGNIFMGSCMPIDGFTDVHYGAAFNYVYRDLASVRVSWEGAPQEFDKGNINAVDRAKSVLRAALEVHPLKPLDVSVGYTVRSGRCTYSVLPASPDLFLPYEHTRISLGNAASLDLSATWRFSDRFNVWGSFENLLNRDWQMVYGIPNKGLTGLVGVSYRF